MEFWYEKLHKVSDIIFYFLGNLVLPLRVEISNSYYLLFWDEPQTSIHGTKLIREKRREINIKFHMNSMSIQKFVCMCILFSTWCTWRISLFHDFDYRDGPAALLPQSVWPRYKLSKCGYMAAHRDFGNIHKQKSRQLFVCNGNSMEGEMITLAWSSSWTHVTKCMEKKRNKKKTANASTHLFRKNKNNKKKEKWK